MKYFKELNEEQQETVLNNLQDLPLFSSFKSACRTLLESSKAYIFDEKLTLHIAPNTEIE